MPVPAAAQDYKLTREKASPRDDAQEAKEIPIYLETLELTAKQKKRLKEEFKAEFEAIEDERKTAHLEEKWDALQNQYKGKMVEDSRMQFNLNRNITKPVVDRVSNYIKQGFLKSDPIYSVSPRPEFDRQGGQAIADNQQDFLDYKLDSLPFRGPVGKTIHSAVKLGTGILKITHVVKQYQRKREARYSGKEGLKQLLANWPDARTRYPDIVKNLEAGKEENLIEDFTDTTYNDPLPQFVELKNFYVRISTDGQEGLNDAKLIVERKNYSWWELEKEEAKGNFDDIDLLIQDKDDKEKKIDKHEKETFDILECTFFFKLDEKDKEPSRITFWYAEEKEIIIGACLYSYDIMEYIPFYISDTETGFYQLGLAEFTTDSQIAQSVLLNLALGAIYQRNTITPITDNQDIIDQFHEKRWVHGIPLEAKAGSVDFLQKYMPQIDVMGMLNIMQFMKQQDEELVGSSSLMSGKENPVDPTAPAAKTIALLKAAGISIDEYIMTMTPAFNQVAYVILQLYYQASKEGRKYKIRSDRVVGSDIFAELSREDMIAKTNIQAQAYAYDFDKLEAKKDDIALWQIIRTDPAFNQNAEAVYEFMRTLVKGWSPKWNNNIDKIMPPLPQFRQKQMAIAVQAVALYVKAVVDQAKAANVKPEFNPQELLGVVMQMQKEAVTPPSKEELKAREEAASGKQAQPV